MSETTTMLTVDKSKPKQGNCRIPQDNYVMRILSEKAKPSSKGNPMIEYECEFVGIRMPDGSISETITVNGDVYVIAGKTCNYYLTLTDDNIDRVEEFFKKFGIDEFPGINPNNPFENPVFQLEKKCFDAIAGCDESPARREPTPEQKQRNQPGDIIQYQGKPVMYYRPKIVNVLGVTEVEVNRPY